MVDVDREIRGSSKLKDEKVLKYENNHIKIPIETQNSIGLH